MKANSKVNFFREEKQIVKHTVVFIYTWGKIRYLLGLANKIPDHIPEQQNVFVFICIFHICKFVTNLSILFKKIWRDLKKSPDKTVHLRLLLNK